MVWQLQAAIRWHWARRSANCCTSTETAPHQQLSHLQLLPAAYKEDDKHLERCKVPSISRPYSPQFL